MQTAGPPPDETMLTATVVFVLLVYCPRRIVWFRVAIMYANYSYRRRRQPVDCVRFFLLVCSTTYGALYEWGVW